MKCSKCGAEFNGKFCPECGNPADEQPVIQQAQAQQPVQQQPIPPNFSKPQKKKGGCLKGGLIALVVFVAIAVISNMVGGGNNKVSVSSAVPTTAKTPVSSVSNSSTTQTDKPSSEKEKAKSYPEGMYKVGSDLPAGEYVLITNSTSYLQVSKDSKGTLDSIVCNDNFTNRSIITVKSGQYLTVKGAEIYDIGTAPAVDTSSGKIPSGMYKVGKDIKAGEYKVHATGRAAYCEISKDSSHVLDSIVSNDNFTADKYITVSDGQYLKLYGAELSLK